MQMPVKIVSGVLAAAVIVSPLLIYSLGKNGFLSSFAQIMPVNQEERGHPYVEAAYEKLTQRKAPVIRAESRKVSINQEYDLLHFVKSAVDFEGAIITDKVRAKGEGITENGIFTATRPGAYIITFVVHDVEGLKGEKSIILLAEEEWGENE